MRFDKGHPALRWLAVLPTTLSIACGGAPRTETATATASVSAVSIDEAYRAIETAQSSLPRQRFDVAAAVQLIGNDPTKIFEWVRDNTQWVPYRGALRGPVGVLMDGVGNSLDRSLLLAELLRVAGHEVRLARGVVDSRLAKELLSRVRMAAASNTAQVAQTNRADDGVQRLASQLKLDQKQIEASLEEVQATHRKNVTQTKERVDQQSPSLAKSVGEPQSEPAEARLEEHWWVQRRMGSQWVDLDVLAADAQPGKTLLQPAEFFNVDRTTGRVDLGAQNRQEITIRVVSEQWKAGKTTEHAILQHTLIPAELTGQTLFLSHVPIPFPQPGIFDQGDDPLAAIQKSAMSPTEWLPVLQMGKDEVFQQSVNVRGEPNSSPIPSGKSSYAPPKAFSGGLDALGGGDDRPSDEAQFTAEWVEYEIRTPGTKPQIVKREIFDLLRSEERSGQAAFSDDDAKRLTRGLSLLGSVQILAQTSLLAPEFVLEKAMSETLANRQGVVALKKALDSGADEVSLPANQPFRATSENLHNLALARFAWSPVGADVYIASPNILTYRRTLKTTPDGKLALREGYDIVSNAVRPRPGARRPAFLTQVTQGTADTNVEALLLKDSKSNAGSALIGQAQPQLVTLRSLQDLAQLGRVWSTAARSEITDALQAGYVIVVPRTQSAPEQGSPTWWRIDPRTGETLGMGPDGWGQGTLENAQLASLIGIYTALHAYIFVTVLTYHLCMAITQIKAGRPANHEEVRHCGCEAVDTGIAGGGAAAGAAGGFLGLTLPWIGAMVGASGAAFMLLLQKLKASVCAN